MKVLKSLLCFLLFFCGFSSGLFAKVEHRVILHFPETHVAFAKVVSRTRQNAQFHFEVCELEKVQNESDLNRIINLRPDLCHPINEAAFSASDPYLKMELSLALQIEVERELSRELEREIKKSTTFKVNFAQIVSVVTFVVVNTVAHAIAQGKSVKFAKHAASYGVAISAAAYIATVYVSDRIFSRIHSHPVLASDIISEDNFLFWRLYVPPEVSPQLVQGVIFRSIDNVTRKFDRILRSSVENADVSEGVTHDSL